MAAYLHVQPLPSALWTDSGPLARSPTLTPLYVERFQGVRDRVRPSHHDYWEMLCVLSGRGGLLGATVATLGPGHVCLVPPGVGHVEHSAAGIEIVWVGLAGDLVARLPQRAVARLALPELVPGFRELWLAASRHYGLIGAELDGRCLALVGRVLRAVAEGQPPAGSGRDRIQAAVDFMNHHFGTRFSVADLAAEAGLSEGHFHREFRRCCGVSPLQYLMRVRIRNAERWLTDSQVPISRVARLCGFADVHYFSRAFHRATGRPPGALRRG